MTSQSILIKIIENKVNEILKIGNAKLPVKINFDQIEIKYSLHGTTAGKAQNLKNNTEFKLWFNLIIMENNLLDYDQTIIHEIAHLYSQAMYKNIKSHGEEFYRINELLGNNRLTRCHNYNVESIKELRKPKIKYIYICMKCHRNFKLSSNLHTKINNGQNRICVNCKQKIVYTGKTSLE